MTKTYFIHGKRFRVSCYIVGTFFQIYGFLFAQVPRSSPIVLLIIILLAIIFLLVFALSLRFKEKVAESVRQTKHFSTSFVMVLTVLQLIFCGYGLIGVVLELLKV
jgi:hypothetical protein